MKEKKSLPIGIFDSGVGGLTVAKEIMRNLPNEKIIYFADSARIPYGSKSKNTVLKFSRQITRFLLTKEVKAIVIACNTASAFAYEELKNELDIPVIGVVEPGANAAAKATINNKIGIIGTVGTISSNLYSKILAKKGNYADVYGQACPLFVPLVEEGMAKDPITYEMAGRYLKDMMQKEIDTLILGCTHYPLLRQTIHDVVGPNVTLVNPAYETTLGLRELLEKQNLLNDDSKFDTPDHEFYVSDATDKFNEAAKKILNLDINNSVQINIENF